MIFDKFCVDKKNLKNYEKARRGRAKLFLIIVYNYFAKVIVLSFLSAI